MIPFTGCRRLVFVAFATVWAILVVIEFFESWEIVVVILTLVGLLTVVGWSFKKDDATKE